MTQIKIVGDIWTGKFQPALTGNRIVDTALLTQFCTKLATWLASQGVKLSVKIEHEFCLLKATDKNTLYLIDSNIASAFPESALNDINYLPVRHESFLHGNPMDSCQLILDRLKISSNSQQLKRD